jgi:hypothetical protein
MTYTDATSVFLADGEPQDISENYWVAVLERSGSFDVDALWAPFPRAERPQIARQLYQLVTEARQRASYWLAKPFEEHGAGTNQNSVLWRGLTRSWGNATSVRLTSLTGWSMYFDEFRGREYVVYRNVIDSMKDALFRITDPSFVYVQEGRTTVKQVGERFVGIGPNSPAYVAGLVRRMNEYRAEDTETPMTADDPRFAWVPDVTEYGYPKGNQQRGQPIELGIVHITAGVDSLGHLIGNNESSAHYLSDRSFRPRVQMVPEAWAAWTAGSREFNERGINWEFEIRAHTPISDEQLRNAADTMRPRLIANNIPFIYLGRNAPLGTRGIIGHADVPDPDGSGWGGSGNHFDPGEFWNWDRFIQLLNQQPDTGLPVMPKTRRDPWRDSNPWGTEWWIPDVFVSEIQSHDWALTGYCISEAFMRGNQIVQYFERARLELSANGQITRGLVGHESLLAEFPERRW